MGVVILSLGRAAPLVTKINFGASFRLTKITRYTVSGTGVQIFLGYLARG